MSKYLRIRIQVRGHDLTIYGLNAKPIEILEFSPEEIQDKLANLLTILGEDGWEVTHERQGFLYLRKLQSA